MKRFGLITLLLLTVFNFQLPQIAQAQGLAERRAIKQYQDEKLPALTKEINEAAGFEVPVQVDWNKLAIAGQAENYMQDGFFTDIYFKPLISALKAVASDEMGKEALKKSLKSISVTYDESTAPASNYANGVTFDNGQLAINFRPWSNTGDIEPRSTAIQKELENKL